MTTLRLLLGDQLNPKHSWFDKIDPNVVYTIMELQQETSYVMHHIQKLLGFFAAMRNFAEELELAGHRVHYLTLDNPSNLPTLTANLDQIIGHFKIEQFEYQLPDEYRLDVQLNDYCKQLKIPSKSWDTEHFYTQRTDFKKFFEGKKTYLMESFYRHLRVKHNIMVLGNKPEGGKWNFDHSNRNRYKGEIPLPFPLDVMHDVQAIKAMIDEQKVNYFGSSNPSKFTWPISRTEALLVLDHFCRNLLPHFGTYQDAMLKEHSTLFHSCLSFALNCKMISPNEVVSHAIMSYRTQNIGIEQVEGFVRQIIGWREYMRGVYWANMPQFASLNYFKHQNKLPEWFWTGETKMNCLKYSIKQSLKSAYAHHIQRLMVLGNFALLAGVNPDELDAWYLGIYIDAIEWVEITNTRGMSQFADGGLVGTKPYVSSANYIDKMSNYCTGCYYDKKKKVGEKACPFNSLYWNFYATHRQLLAKNPRIGMAYVSWDKTSKKDQVELLDQAAKYLENLNSL